MPKNSTTKGAPVRMRPANDSAAELAALIAAVLNHPDTPACIYNALADAVSDLYYYPKGYRDSVEHLTPLIAANIENRGEAAA